MINFMYLFSSCPLLYRNPDGGAQTQVRVSHVPSEPTDCPNALFSVHILESANKIPYAITDMVADLSKTPHAAGSSATPLDIPRGLISSPTINLVRDMHDYLTTTVGPIFAVYHGKLSEEEKTKVFRQWVGGARGVIWMIATSGFGPMVIDQRNVQWVIHARQSYTI